jgi:hypothetical protein
MKRFILLSLFVLTAALAIGCSGANLAQTTSESAPPMPPSAQQPYNDAVTNKGSAAGGDVVPGTAPLPRAPSETDSTAYQAQNDQRMIVYTGALSLQVNDTADTINKITDLLKNVNGYISNKSVVAYGKDKLRGTITIRIPAVALEPTLAQIKALGVKVLKEDANSNDVTSEYVDLDARRKNLEAYEVELQKLLDTVRERTGKAEDILAVYNQLTQVRGEIEQIKGRQNYLQNTSTLATYTIELVPIEEVVVEGKPGWDPGRVFGESLDGLVGSLQALIELTIRFTVGVLPVLILLFLPFIVLFLIIRFFWKKRAPKKVVPAK